MKLMHCLIVSLLGSCSGLLSMESHEKNILHVVVSKTRQFLDQESRKTQFAAKSDEVLECYSKKSLMPEIQKNSAFEQLPADISRHITSYLLYVQGPHESACLYTAAGNIRNFMASSKIIKEQLDTHEFNGYIIGALVNRYAQKSFIPVVIALATPSAVRWLKKKNQDEISEPLKIKVNNRIEKYLKGAACDRNYGLCHFLINNFPFLVAKESAQWALSYAAKDGKNGLVRKLLSLGVSADAKYIMNNYAIVNATRKGHGAVVEQLITSGANVNNYTDKRHGPALSIAIKCGYDQIAQKLMTAPGAALNIFCEKITPLMHAAGQGNIIIMEQLLQRGAWIDIAHRYGITALMHAAKNDKVASVERLIAAGADRNKKNEHGQTALMLASFEGHYDVVQQLLPIVKMMCIYRIMKEEPHCLRRSLKATVRW